MRTLLITSGSYLTDTLATEFGRIPPTFLPVGHDTLFEVQCGLLRSDVVETFLSVPHDHRIAPPIRSRLVRAGLQLLRVDPEASVGRGVGEAIEQVLASQADDKSNLVVLHGDTLLRDLNLATAPADFYVVSQPSHVHSWAFVSHNDAGVEFHTGEHGPSARPDTPWVLAGAFGFSRPDLFVELLRLESFDWLRALTAYMNRVEASVVVSVDWHDFSSHHSYHVSKRHMMTPREFNELAVARDVVVKRSRQKEKLHSEHRWFHALPRQLRLFTPVVFDYRETGQVAEYEIEYLYMPMFSHLLIFGRLPPYVWRQAFQACDEFLQCCRLGEIRIDDTDPEELRHSLYWGKTEKRLQAFAEQSGITLKKSVIINGRRLPGLADVARLVYEHIPAPGLDDIGVMHGDFCASNIFYDFAARRVKVIDPRGLLPNGKVTIHGDRRYDVAKLAHSFVGFYDLIVSGFYRLAWDDGGTELKLHLEMDGSAELNLIAEIFSEIPFGGYLLDSRGVYDIMISLFLSMLPLHSDDPHRQRALLANAYRLFDARHVANYAA